MGIAVDPKSVVPGGTATRELIYTICPVLVASNVALELGWIEDNLAKVGARATYLRSIAEPGIWKAHYNHDSDRLIRDGGNSPAIWSHADLRPTVLLGLTQAQPAGKIIVRADSEFFRVGDLKGHRFGIYASRNDGKIDHRRATTEHGILTTLKVHGLKRDDVQWVDVEDADAHDEAPANRPGGVWAQSRDGWNRLAGGVRTLEAKALLDGRIDALYDYSVGNAAVLERTGLFKVIEDLDNYPDWTLRIANAPRTLAVSKAFAEANRDIVVAYIRANIRAGRWINANPDAAAEIFLRTTIYPDAREIAKALRNYDLVPNLDPQNLAGLAIEKDFLIAHGYIRNDFDISQWADPSYLEEAHATL
ncbi:ABC-type nitrate/sulfonate/bicarbonate transport system, substrate-binding protein [Devosia enhydra]|uniref:ABC-type nitrate/sulfonate/bicarbonate transport system, substrate-binding protein n=1 Tax=Devosia enhydra TaxID=665118 RepID=A0A1K2HTE8_9HYPH|nr:ABC transporter substrate-binding protein [Devosia enhydra]SFZ81420.1 ABC-type nitrate/sulfonate/bicarbonate transport system, substrate-binding protein [Devosia enhydra]